MAQPYTMQGRDRDYYVRTLLAEAGGEDAIGQAAAAHVIKNRLLDGGYGKSITDVVLAPKQFSAWNKDGSGNSIGHNADPNSEAYKRTANIVDQVMAGGIPDMTKGATHYWADSGMKKLVDDGYQTNLLPKWADTMTKQRGNDGLYEHGGHKFTGRRKGYAEESFGPAPVEQVTTSGLDGAPLPLEEVMRVANHGILSANEEQWGEGVAPDDYTNQPWYFAGGGASSGGGGGGSGQPSQLDVQTVRSNLDQSKNESQPTTMMGKLDKWLTKDRSLALLALGSGMLSSNGNFAEQLGAGGLLMANELGRQEDRDVQQSQFDDNIAIDLMKHRDTMDLNNAKMQQAATKSPNRKMREQTFQLKDPETGEVTGSILGFYDENDQGGGAPVIRDANGNQINDRVGVPINNSYAVGEKNLLDGAKLAKSVEELSEMDYNLQRGDELLDRLQNQDSGLMAGFNKARSAWNVLMNQPNSAELLKQITTEAEFRNVVLGNRDALVDGVPSNADMKDVWIASGGDLSSFFASPEVVYEQVYRNLKAQEHSRDTKREVYDTQMRAANPNSEYVNPKQAYKLKERKTKTGAESDKPALKGDKTAEDYIKQYR